MNASPNRILRIATRQSPLALWQAKYVAGRLEALGEQTQIVPLRAHGDTDLRPVESSGAVGLFTKRIQQALIDHDADVAVHSLKDLPTETDPRLMIAAVPERETIRDCLVTRDEPLSLDQLADAARVGTGSRRRAAQLKHRRRDLQILPIRGNVQTRLEKLYQGEFDAIVLAEAGLVRLELDEVERTRLPLEVMLPAPGQGALAVEVRTDDSSAGEVLRRINDPVTRAAVTAERGLLANLNGGCLAPIAALARLEENALRLTARVLSADGAKQLVESQQRQLDATEPVEPDQWLADATALADSVSEALSSQGARELVAQAR